MKLRTAIFWTVFGLGVLPLLALIAVNLRGHINRHELVAQQQILERTRLRQENLSLTVQYLKENLRRSTILPEIHSVFTGDMEELSLEKVRAALFQWFGEEDSVSGLKLIDRQGRVRLNLVPELNGGFAFGDNDDIQQLAVSPQEFVALDRGKGIRVFFRDRAEKGQDGPGVIRQELLFVAPVRKLNEKMDITGYLAMTVPLESLLKEFRQTAWINRNGKYLNYFMEAGSAGSGLIEDFPNHSAFVDFPGLRAHMTGNSLFIADSRQPQKYTFLPLSLNEEDLVDIWIGSRIDTSGAEQWKRSLVQNIAVILFITTLVVFFIAKYLAAKIDLLRQDMLTGLNRTLNDEQETPFDWHGPAEIRDLAKELTTLSTNYTVSRKERRRAEKELRESEDMFRRLTASAQDAIIMMDHEGSIAFWNLAAEKIFGYTENEALWQPIHALLALRRNEPESEDAKENSDLEGRPVSAGGAFPDIFEVVARKKDGKDVIVELSLAAARIQDQWHAIWIARDITERMRAEKEARLRRQQLIQADKMRSLGLLVSGVAHEINNPNSITILNIALLSKAWNSVKPILEEYYQENGQFTIAGLDYSEMRDQVSRLFLESEESCKRIRTIVKDLKDYVRQESTQHTDSVQLNDVVETAVRLTRNQLNKATSNLFVCLSPDLPLIKGHRQRLEQVVINLIQNSCDSLEKTESKISIETLFLSEKKQVRLLVEDEGRGISKEDLDKILNPFYTTKRETGGTGLGLSVSAGIVREHKGEIKFQSKPGKGTEVTVSFPVAGEQRGE
jgi:PAS domain S-box-containing protein